MLMSAKTSHVIQMQTATTLMGIFIVCVSQNILEMDHFALQVLLLGKI